MQTRKKNIAARILRSFVNRCLRLPVYLLLISTFPVTTFAESELTLVTGDMALGFYSSPEQTGLVDELLEVALGRIGYKLNVLTVPAERSLKLSASGAVDGELLRTHFIEKKFPTLLRVPEPLIESEFVVFSREPVDLAAGWGSLAGKSVGLIIGMKIIEDSVPESAVVTRVGSADQLFFLLLKDRVDMVVFVKDIGEYYLNKNNIEGLVISEALDRVPSYTYLHPKNSALLPMLEESLKKLKEDGTYQKLFSRHISGRGQAFSK